MKLFRLIATIAVFTALVQYVGAQHAHHAAPESSTPKSEKTYLLDEFGRLGHCEFGARFDTFFAELSESSGAQGYVIFYKSKDELPGRYEEGGLRRLFEQHLAFRNFDSDRVTVIDGGFRDETQTEIWMVPPGGEAPTPSRTVTAPSIPTTKTFLFDKSWVLMSEDSTEGLREFELPTVKARREAEEAEGEAAYQRELAESKDQSTEENNVVAEDEPAEPEEEYKDTRTPEEIEAEKFDWARDKFAKLLADRKDSTGVIIFYADDETYDINRLRQFIEQGRKWIADAARIKTDRISIEFGGYRGMVETEFWIVPSKGTKPVASPETREIPEPEPETEN